MQTKINTFFKSQNPSPNKSKIIFHRNSDDDDSQRSMVTSDLSKGVSRGMKSTRKISKNGIDDLGRTFISSKILSNKRSYAQLHLDLGQSDFMFHSCSTCGFKYACGEQADEKLHKQLHKDYMEGIQFKGWENERVVSTSSTEAGRIILVLDGDPPAHKKRVEKILQMMDVDLGCSGSLIHKLCKVYLYVCQRRIAGCLVVEPISGAYRVLCKSETTPRNLDDAIAKRSKPDSSVLQFGSISLQREAKEKTGPEVKLNASIKDFMGAILLEGEALPATCGVRAIWVAPAMRRKHIATQLLDAARKSFKEGIVLDASQLAFSDPASTGKALASRYCCTPAFLAYRAER